MTTGANLLKLPDIVPIDRVTAGVTIRYEIAITVINGDLASDWPVYHASIEATVLCFASPLSVNWPIKSGQL